MNESDEIGSAGEAMRELKVSIKRLEDAVDMRISAGTSIAGLRAELTELTTKRDHLDAQVEELEQRQEEFEKARQDVLSRVDNAIETLRHVLKSGE